MLTFIFTPLLGLGYLGLWEESKRRSKGCDFFVISGLGGKIRMPDSSSLVFLSSSIFPSSKRTLIDLSLRVTVGDKAGQLPVLVKSTG